MLTANAPTNHVTVGKVYQVFMQCLRVFMILSDMIFIGKNTLKALKNSICVIQVFDMQYSVAGIWTMAESMGNIVVSNFFAVDMMSMLESSIKEIDFVAQGAA